MYQYTIKRPLQLLLENKQDITQDFKNMSWYDQFYNVTKSSIFDNLRKYTMLSHKHVPGQ